MNRNLFIIAAALVLASCGGNHQKADDPLADSGRTQRTERLLANLRALGDSAVYLFGHHDATVSGIGWQADFTADSTVHQRSDVHSVCNDHPALLSFDLSGIERGDSLNLAGIPFRRIRQEVIAHYDRGGMVTLSWTPSDDGGDRVAQFLKTLVTPYGVTVPVAFRLRGADKSGFRVQGSKFKEQGVTNALMVYSQQLQTPAHADTYLRNYPGDDVIDILGLDCYCQLPDADTLRIADYATTLDHNLTMLCALARQHGKAAALTETGYDGIRTKDWWTHTLAPVLEKHPISYVLLWHNQGSRFKDQGSRFFAPYPGQQSASDFVRFYNDPRTLFLRDVNALYN